MMDRSNQTNEATGLFEDTNPVQAEEDAKFDNYVNAMRALKTDDATATLWKTVLTLPRWYFIIRRAPGAGGFHPLAAVIDGTPHVFAFTSGYRAMTFAKKRNLGCNGEPPTVFSFTTAQASKMVSEYAKDMSGVLVVNPDETPLKIELNAVVPIWEALQKTPETARSAEPRKASGDWRTMTAKEKIGTVAFCLVLVAIGVCVWIWPDLEHQIDDGGIHGRGARRVVFWMGLIWNRPVGTILGLLGILGFRGLFIKAEDVEMERSKHSGESTGDVPDALAPSPPSVDFEALSATARASGGKDDSDKLWRAVFELGDWWFIARGTLEENNVRPYCGVVDGKPFIFAFTDGDRCSDYAKTSKLLAEGESTKVMSVPTKGGVGWLLDFAGQGVFGVLFNAGENGFYVPLSNLEETRSMALFAPKEP